MSPVIATPRRDASFSNVGDVAGSSCAGSCQPLVWCPPVPRHNLVTWQVWQYVNHIPALAYIRFTFAEAVPLAELRDDQRLLVQQTPPGRGWLDGSRCCCSSQSKSHRYLSTLICKRLDRYCVSGGHSQAQNWVVNCASAACRGSACPASERALKHRQACDSRG